MAHAPWLVQRVDNNLNVLEEELAPERFFEGFLEGGEHGGVVLEGKPHDLMVEGPELDPGLERGPVARGHALAKLTIRDLFRGCHGSLLLGCLPS